MIILVAPQAENTTFIQNSRLSRTLKMGQDHKNRTGKAHRSYDRAKLESSRLNTVSKNQCIIFVMSRDVSLCQEICPCVKRCVLVSRAVSLCQERCPKPSPPKPHPLMRFDGSETRLSDSPVSYSPIKRHLCQSSSVCV